MFTPPGYRKRLLSDVERWTGTGLINRAAADAIAEEYKTDSSHAIMTVLAFVFAILAAAGLIALVAANWHQIPREVRVAGLLAINLAVLGACLVFSLSRKTGSIAIETAAALSVMSTAASISLIGQIYHFPSNWPGFALAMMAVAGATALVARSSACLWLAAAALISYHLATLTEAPGGLLAFYGGAARLTQWTQEDKIFFGFSILLIGIAVSRWTARSGAWTIFVAALPLYWWLGSRGFLPENTGQPLLWAVCGIVAVSLVAHEFRAADRCEATLSALVGLFAIGLATLSLQNYRLTPGMPHSLGVAAWQGQLAIAAAAALAIAAAVRRYTDRTALFWLAAAMAVPFAANILWPFDPRGGFEQISPVRLVVMLLLPLTLLAVEARLSDRRKTFAFVVAAVIAVVCYHVWTSKDLLTLGWVFLGGSAVIGMVVLASRTFSPRPRNPVSVGAS